MKIEGPGMVRLGLRQAYQYDAPLGEFLSGAGEISPWLLYRIYGSLAIILILKSNSDGQVIPMTVK